MRLSRGQKQRCNLADIKTFLPLVTDACYSVLSFPAIDGALVVAPLSARTLSPVGAYDR